MHGGCAFAHRFSHARKLLHSFAFGRQSDERRCYLRVCGNRIKQCFEKIRRFSPRKIFSAHKTHRSLAKIEITGFTHHRLQVHRVLIWLAIATAFIIARALITVSSYSRRGSESETMPAPAWKYALPFFNTAHRSAIQESTLPLNPKYPIAPAYPPRRVFSNYLMLCIARIFGAYELL